MTTVLIADDQELVRTGFRLILGAGVPPLEVVGEAADGSDAIRATRELDPDVVLMDLRMPVMDGIEATRRLVRGGVRARVLVLTTFDADEQVVEAFRAGASGFLLKNAPAHRLVEGVHAVAAGEALLAPGITRRLIAEFMHTRSGDSSVLAVLTPREREVLGHIGRGWSNSEIGENLHLTNGTVKTHVNHILTKLSLRDRVQAVVLAFETGLVPIQATHGEHRFSRDSGD